jgi:hypothetical protein
MADDQEQQLLSLVPYDGSGVGNTRLIRELRWDEENYWDIRNRLVERGGLELGRGRGGSVRRIVRGGMTPGAAPFAPECAESKDTRLTESDLYAPIARVLDDKWTKDKRVESAIIATTAHQGSRATGGKWTRPDITVATLSTYPYVPGRHFDVITFEIKPCDAIDVTAIYEALAHLRSATRAYVMLHVPDAHSEDLEELILEICAEAKKHGIGVYTFADPANYETWDERVEPIRRDPLPAYPFWSRGDPGSRLTPPCVSGVAEGKFRGWPRSDPDHDAINGAGLAAG